MTANIAILYYISLSHNFTLYNNLIFIQYLDSLSPKIRANTGIVPVNPHNFPLSNNKNADLSDLLRWQNTSFQYTVELYEI